MFKVLHLTAHLGGGVGKAISGLVAQAASVRSDVTHTIACLEQPEKSQFIERICARGGEIIIAPTAEQLAARVADADIVQLEWWNHPATIEALCSLTQVPMRLLVWSHVNGLFNPIIPQLLMRAAHRTAFTSPCTFDTAEVAELGSEMRDRFDVVSSSGGFDGFPLPSIRLATEPLSVGYIGSLNFAKLHPHYIDYLSAVDQPGFTVNMIGDLTNRELLSRQCAERGKPDLLRFRGYTTDIATELSSINVLAYLLNPEHYGTTENALLEAMATGIVPIVLDNPAERHIVEHGKTGLIVHSATEFAEAVHWLATHPQERLQMGLRAADSVRQRYTAHQMEEKLHGQYQSMLQMDKKQIPFTRIFGVDPADWFLSCQKMPQLFANDGQLRVHSATDRDLSRHGLLEKTKGSVFHFHRHFPSDAKLAQWATRLEAMS